MSLKLVVFAIILSAGCARAGCEGTKWEAFSSSVDDYLATVEEAAAEGMQEEAIPKILNRAKDLEREWLEIETSSRRSQVEVPQGIADRVAFIRFFTPILLVRYDQEAQRLTFSHLSTHGITEEGVADTYATISVKFLEHLESSVRSESGGAVSLPRSPFELQSVIHETTPGLWSQLGKQTIGELRQSLDSLCATEDQR